MPVACNILYPVAFLANLPLSAFILLIFSSTRSIFNDSAPRFHIGEY